jgi:hypothetical protein
MYIVYATGEHGKGYVQKIGEFENPEEFIIHVGLFADDVEITIEESSRLPEQDSF